MDMLIEYNEDTGTYVIDDGIRFIEISEEELSKLIEIRDQRRG